MTTVAFPLIRQQTRLIISGDSQTQAGLFGFSHYPELYAAAQPKASLLNYAVGGAMISTLVSQASTIIANKYPPWKNIFVSLEGTNDLFAAAAGGNPSGDTVTWLASYAAFLDTIRAGGFTVVVSTLEATTTAGYAALRAQARTAILTWPGVHCDYVIDIGGDGVFGPDAVASNATYYQGDGIHWTAAGQSYYEANIFAPLMDGLL